MNSNPNNSKSSWQPCPDGTIKSVSSAIRVRETAAARRQFLKSAAGAAVVLSAAGFTGWSLFGPTPSSSFKPNPIYPGGVACSQVMTNLPAYISKSLEDQSFFDAITVHLAECNHCRTEHNCLSGAKTNTA